MRTKNFLIGLLSLVAVSVVLIIFGQQKPKAIQNIVSTTHEQFRHFKVTLTESGSKTLAVDEKYLKLLGLAEKNTPIYPQNVWHNTSLPVIVTYVTEDRESQAIGLINNVARILPNNTILIYNIGLGNHGLRTLLNYCNSSHCQVITFALSDYPSHVQDVNLHAYRPIIIQDALQHTGSVLFMEASKRFHRHVTAEALMELRDTVTKGTAIIAWPMESKNAVSTLTHKKMFDYFHTDTDNFLFLPMVSADVLLVVNTGGVHADIMLPWVQCALTPDCIAPIGAQSAGCRFDKKPQYRYSGCHSYDTSALNIVLGIKFKLEYSKYTYQSEGVSFVSVPLEMAQHALMGLELNTTTEGETKRSY